MVGIESLVTSIGETGCVRYSLVVALGERRVLVDLLVSCLFFFLFVVWVDSLREINVYTNDSKYERLK